MKAQSVYYVDAGIVNNVGHNLETIEFLKKSLGQDINFTVIAGKRFEGNTEGLRILPLLRYGSPHWPMPSHYMQYLRALEQRYRFEFLDDLAQRLKAQELQQDLSTLSLEKEAQIIINSMELDDAYLQCEALWALEPSLKVKIILHYSPFAAHAVAVRPRLKKPIERIERLAPEDDRVSFFADTTKLCQVYTALLRRPVTLLPIPHAKRGERSNRNSSPPPYRVAYFGTYSEAKTPHLIPEIIRLIANNTALVWSVYITYISKNRVINAFEQELRTLENKTGKLTYQTGPFSTQQIDDLFAQSDIFLIPYHSHDYEIQSSGVVMEALVSGKIPLISRSMADAGMLAEIDPHLVFRPNNEMDMVASIEYVTRNYREIKEKLHPLQQKMEAFHNPDSFIKTLVG